MNTSSWKESGYAALGGEEMGREAEEDQVDFLMNKRMLHKDN